MFFKKVLKALWYRILKELDCDIWGWDSQGQGMLSL